MMSYDSSNWKFGKAIRPLFADPVTFDKHFEPSNIIFLMSTILMKFL